jgi:phosphatidylglycerol:prolipoprotein diacylglycerol transferase
VLNYLAYWVHDWDPFLIQFSENFGIRYYGLAYLAGFLTAAFLFRTYWTKNRTPIAPDMQSDFIFAAIIGVLAGGRFGYFLFYEPATLFREPAAFFRIWDGGMASHGGFIGVFLAIVWVCRKRKVSLLHAGDIFTSLAPAGLMFGRIANFINGELWGKVSLVPWAVIFPESAPGLPPAEVPPRHPSQLYEAALEGLVLLVYTQWRIWKSPVVAREPGRLAGEFLLLYAVGRVIAEQFREPDATVSLIFGLSRGSILSLVMIVLGVTVLVFARRQRTEKDIPIKK